MGAALPFISIGSSIIGLGGKLLGGIGGAMSGRAAADYQAQVARNNLRIAKWNASQAQQQGEIAATNEGLRGRAALGAITADQAASGVDINSGSAVDVRASAARLAQLNTMTIKSDAARKVYGYNLAAQQAAAEKRLAQASKPTVLQSILGIGTSVLGGASGVASQGYDLYQSGALDIGGGGGDAGLVSPKSSEF